MTRNGNEPSLDKVDARIFEIISNMSKAENQKLIFILISNLSENKKRKLLSVLISGLSEAKKRNLLKKLENWYRSKFADMREHPRKSSFIPVEFSSYNLNFIDFIQNISYGGVFIQTDGNFYMGQKITLTFSLPKTEEDITVGGKVVRVDSNGIGVKFDELLPEI